MTTKYTTGQAVLIPAVIRSASEENGVVKYHVDTGDIWDGITEDKITEAPEASAISFDNALRRMNREIWR